jgi:stage II sporulation protein AA (anti-sigma F factor antagonist)
MKLERAPTNGRGTVIAVHGELDVSTRDELRAELLRAINREPRAAATIDLEHCTFIDSTALAVIVEAGQMLDENGQKLRVANLRDQPKQVFELTSIDEAPFLRLTESV